MVKVSSGTAFSRRGVGAVLMALVVAIAALLAISFASAGSAKPAAARESVTSAQPVVDSNYVPHRENNHGALP
jgi:hypothetical protein